MTFKSSLLLFDIIAPLNLDERETMFPTDGHMVKVSLIHPPDAFCPTLNSLQPFHTLGK